MPVLVVQMGHAGRTSGATGAPGEQLFTQTVGAECVRLLNTDGWSVHLIPADTTNSAYRGDAFVAVHADGNTNPAVRGASIGYQTNAGRDLAHAWQAAWVAHGFTGPWHPDNYTTNLAQYYGVRYAVAEGNTRACIIECGTITNPEDLALMNPTEVALSIGEAVGIAQPDSPPAVTSAEELVMQDGSLYYAKGDKAPNIYLIRVSFADSQPLLRRAVEPAEWEIARQAGKEALAVFDQKTFDAIPKLEGSP